MVLAATDMIEETENHSSSPVSDAFMQSTEKARP